MRAEAPSLPATPTRHETGSQGHFDRRTVFTVFAAIVAVTFLLRIFYAGYLYQDDGLWFAAAEELLRGKALYRDIYFDKPPGIALFYAALFKLFGAHILTIRLFTIIYSIAVSAMLYVFGRRGPARADRRRHRCRHSVGRPCPGNRSRRRAGSACAT